MQRIFFNLSAYTWYNNGLLNKYYLDDLDSTVQGNSKGNVSQFCLNLGYPWIDFNKISTTMMASWRVTQNVILLWKCRSRSSFKKIDVSQLLYERLLPNFHRNDGTLACNKSDLSADVENVDLGHPLQKSLYLVYYMIDFNQLLTKMMQLGLATQNVISADFENVDQDWDYNDSIHKIEKPHIGAGILCHLAAKYVDFILSKHWNDTESASKNLHVFYMSFSHKFEVMYVSTDIVHSWSLGSSQHFAYIYFLNWFSFLQFHSVRIRILSDPYTLL